VVRPLGTGAGALLLDAPPASAVTAGW